MSERPLLPPLPAQPTLVLLSANPHTDPYPVYPLALSYLASAVRRRLPQVKVELLDIQLDDDAALQARLLSQALVAPGPAGRWMIERLKHCAQNAV